MRLPQINAEELVPWCERRGLDAREISASGIEEWRRRDGIHYLLRRHATSGPTRVEVVAPFDDPMPSLYRMSGVSRLDGK